MRSTGLPTIDRAGAAALADWTDQPVASVYQSIELGRPAKEIEVRLRSAAREVRHAVMERHGMAAADAARYSDRLHDVDLTPWVRTTRARVQRSAVGRATRHRWRP